MELTQFEISLFKKHITLYTMGMAIKRGIEPTEKNLMKILDESDEAIDSALAFKAFTSPDEEIDQDDFCDYSFTVCMEEFGEEIMEQIVEVMENV